MGLFDFFRKKESNNDSGFKHVFFHYYNPNGERVTLGRIFEKDKLKSKYLKNGGDLTSKRMHQYVSPQSYSELKLDEEGGSLTRERLEDICGNGSKPYSEKGGYIIRPSEENGSWKLREFGPVRRIEPGLPSEILIKGS